MVFKTWILCVYSLIFLLHYSFAYGYFFSIPFCISYSSIFMYLLLISRLQSILSYVQWFFSFAFRPQWSPLCINYALRYFPLYSLSNTSHKLTKTIVDFSLIFCLQDRHNWYFGLYPLVFYLSFFKYTACVSFLHCTKTVTISKKNLFCAVGWVQLSFLLFLIFNALFLIPRFVWKLRKWSYYIPSNTSLYVSSMSHSSLLLPI